MNHTIIARGLGLLVAALILPVSAEVLELPEAGAATAAATPALPSRGEPQARVLKQYGEPTTRHPAVGGGSIHQPQITRWDYPGFAVFFENAHVVDAVVPNQPAPLFNTDELGAATP